MRDPIGRGKQGRLGALAFVGVLATLCGAAPAADAFSITNFSAQPVSKAAGANSDLTVSFNVGDSAAGLKDLTVHLPPGLIGNPLATPTCTEAKLKADSCPAASDVGDATNDVIVKPLGLLPIPLTVNGQVYNVEPRQGEPARFGIVLDPAPVPGLGAALPKIVLQQTARLRQSDFGLDTSLNDIPRSAKIAGVSTPLEVTGVSLTLKGKIGGKGFLRNPTSCRVQPVTIDADAYNNATATAQDQFTTTNCNALPFSPKFSAGIKQLTPDLLNPIEMSTTISQTIEEAGLKKAVVSLPLEVSGNSSALAIRCSAADFAAGNCADDTIVGSGVAASPLQARPLTGNVYLLDPSTSALPDLGIDLKGGLALKVKGSLSIVPVAGGGQIVVTFDGLPDIPLSEFTLTFDGGPGGLNLVSRSPCDPPPLSFNAAFTGQSAQTLNVVSPADATCPGSPGAKPKATVKLGKLKSGKPKVRLTLRAGSAKLRSAKVVLPKGLKTGAKRKLNRGADVSGGSVRGHGKRLSVKAKGGGVDRIRVKLSKGAIRAKHGTKAKKLKPFKLRIRDADGKLTKLAVEAK